MSEWYLNPVGGATLTGLAAVALVLALVFAGLPRHRLLPSRRAILLALRLGVVLLAVLAMLRPTLVHSTLKKQSATLVLLLDRSKSMSIADALGGKTRYEQLSRALEDAQPALEKLAKDLEVKLYAFDAELHPIEFERGRINLERVPDGTQTAIGAALEGVLQRESGKRLSGVILLSDGAQRAYAPVDLAPQGPARRLGDLGFPLYTLAFGQARGLGQARDVSLRDLSVNPTVYVKNDLTVQGSARVDGLAGRPIGVQLLLESAAGKMEQVARSEIKPQQDGQPIPLELHAIPQTPGEYKLTLRSDPQPGELVTTNNELSTFVTVLEGGVNVLYIEGAPRVDQKYLRRSLDASADIKVDFIGLNERDPKSRQVDLKDRFRRGRYNVFVVGDVDSTQFTREELKMLADAVRDGAGLVMLGGFHTFGPGGYADTPLAEVLPVAMDARERQRPGDPPRGDMHIAGPIKMRPTTPLGQRHYLMSSLDPDGRGPIWDRLPSMEGANRLGIAKPNAQVLAETPQGKPLLVVHEPVGRVMAFAADSTWHWWMEGFEAHHKRFWRQVVLWLARKDEATDGRVWVKLAQRRLAPRGRVEFTAGAISPQGEPVTNAQFEASVTLPDGTQQKVNLVRQGDNMSGSFDNTQAAGDYAIRVTARSASAPEASAKSRFLVYEQDLELDNAAADPTLLASLSAMTRDVGGVTLAPEELGDLLTRIAETPLEMEVEALVKRTPWDTWPFFLAFVGLISTEWYLRKKWGLV